MKDNVIHRFYTAFQNMDVEAMISCYHDEIEFEDPAFGCLQGENACNMWRMLIDSQRGKDFKVDFSKINIEGDKGSAHWEARYTFSKTGRRVHNKIDAKFDIKDGLITAHKDSFSLHKWARQALGPQGLLLGWTGLFQRRLQSQTNKMLSKYTSRNL